jgi:hypothetical protein
MDLNEARKVVWIGSNRRPLGELLDIGYLNKERLIWAVEHVKNSTVQQAAAVLLAWLTQSSNNPTNRKKAIVSSSQMALPGLDVKISIEKAREVVWPFSPYKGEPMGPLVATRKLSLKDLGYAIEYASDSKVKAAAIALTAIRLRQIVKEPEPTKGHLRVIAEGRSFSERRQLQLVLLEGLIAGIALGSLLYYLFTSLFFQNPNQSHRMVSDYLSTPMGAISLLVGIFITICLVWLIIHAFEWMMNKLDQQVDKYRRGQEGENRVIDTLRVAMDGEWTIFKNVDLPRNKGGDLDSVLVGPAGLWVLEIKTLSGIFRNNCEKWEYLSGKKWRSFRKSPSKQATYSAANLRRFLEADGIKIKWINAVVVWANPESPVEVENPSVAVWKMDRLEDELGNIQEGKELSDIYRQKICEKLTKLVEGQKR